ncbi:phage tail assembly chaperone [Pseudomonas sp. PH1b]|uniref:phage tail assembly chaperone n=1 Tax=Pseudomonas sp. PH1b TaxID=1397282 RepID=UPI0021088383|nr:phage tail assembly chaperone [Pseudomonas sp. PH1b]
MSGFKVLSVSASAGTMLVDWGNVTLNHYIPQEILTSPDIDALALANVIEGMRPAPAVTLELPPALQAIVEPFNLDDERAWRLAELAAVTWLRDRHRDQLEIKAPTNLSDQQFTELLVYMQVLRDWPQSPDFPQIEQRPVAPSWIAEQSQ